MNKILLILAILFLAAISLPAQAVELPTIRTNVQIHGADNTSPEKPLSFLDNQPLVLVEFVEAKKDSVGNVTPPSTILTVENSYGVSYEDLGEWKETSYEEHESPAGMYATAIIISVDVDSTKAIPLWWAYKIIDRVGNTHYEVHILNMILFQGSRWIINSTPRPEFANAVWQECQY